MYRKILVGTTAASRPRTHWRSGIDAEPVLVSGEPATALAEAANEPGTVLILGSRRYGPLRRVLLGSVSRALVARLPAR
jgi:nucleotide-binding universal stress UspA family protein